MPDADQPKGLPITIALPGEWMLKSVMGPVLSEMGEDLKRVYASGRDRIIHAAHKKLARPDDGYSSNLRVAHEVITGGAFTDDEVCAEYFGGVLASRSIDGKNDDPIQFLSTIKSLSSKQLHLHYVLYNCFNKVLLAGLQKGEPEIHVGNANFVIKKSACISYEEILQLGLPLDRDAHILFRHGLIDTYSTSEIEVAGGKSFHYFRASPTVYGIMLYATAHNKPELWIEFQKKEFGDWEGVSLPKHFGKAPEDAYNLNWTHSSTAIEPSSPDKAGISV